MEDDGESKGMAPERAYPLPVCDNGTEEEPGRLIEAVSAVKSRPCSALGGEGEGSIEQQFRGQSDQALNRTIANMKTTLRIMANKLADRGEKLRTTILRQEAELQRRKNCREDDKCRKVVQSGDSRSCIGGSDFTAPRSPFSAPSSPSIFNSHIRSQLDHNVGHWTTSVARKEISTLHHRGSKSARVDRKFSALGIQKGGISSRPAPFQSPKNLSVNVFKQSLSNGTRKRHLSTTPLPGHSEEQLPGCFAKKNSCVQTSLGSQESDKTIYLVGEEEPEVSKKIQAADQVNERTEESRIYYPSRDDPQAHYICYSDLECLAPESYLSSAIMNFCIWYLLKKASSADAKRCDYHFFNTFFYSKLKEEVLRKDGESHFVKFRRWWKGINIFDQAYIFLPIYENLHWSLVIISVPDKNQESGPMLLHLDSLKLHSSKSILANIRSFLIEEWKFLRQEESDFQCPLSDKIWQNLPQRIDEKIVEVPQQKNDYDCGLFVLYFIKHLLENAPERMKEEDLAMLGRHWFKPEAASSLRQKIRKILKEEFNKDEGKRFSNPSVLF